MRRLKEGEGGLKGGGRGGRGKKKANLGSHTDSLLERGGTSGSDHELLHGEAVASVGSAVDHVHPGNGHHELLVACGFDELLVKIAGCNG